MPSNIVDYGTVKEPNLDEISKTSGCLLKRYNRILGKEFVINGFLQLEPTPEKPYTARAILEVLKFKNAEKVGDLYVLLFASGDATGKVGDYTLEQFTEIPSEYQFSTKPERVLPRNKSKEGVLAEACFPLGTFEGKNVSPYTISLEQITVDNVNEPTCLIKGLQIRHDSYALLIDGEPRRCGPTILSESEDNSFEFPIYLTCGYRRNGQRFGDPHATFYNPKLAEGHPNRMQVAGFLSVEDKDNPLCKVLDEVGIVPE